MKKIFLTVLTLVAVCGMSSCGSSKSVQTPPPSGMVEETIPLSGAEYHSDANYYRAVQNAASSDRSMAQKMAMQNCRQELAANIQAEMKLVIENYAKAQSTQFGEDIKGQYQELAYTAINQRMVDVQVVGEKLYKETNGNFRYYVCLQLPKKSIEEAMMAIAEGSAQLNLEIDLEMFKRIFDEQMAAYDK